MLPDGDGAEVLALVRQENLGIRVAVISASGPSSGYMRDAMRHRPDVVFHKPWSLNEIAAWLNQSLAGGETPPPPRDCN
jgi:DNA-binding NarL/FixJ family response regulator